MNEGPMKKNSEAPAPEIDRLVRLRQLASKIGASLDFQETLDAIVNAIADLVPCSLAEISLWDEERQLMTLRALRCPPERAYPIGQSYPAGHGYTGWVIENKRPLWVSDVEARDDIRPDILPGERPFRSYIGLPLIVGEELIGTLVLVHDEAGVFDQDDFALLETMAGYAAAVLHKSRLYDQLAHRHQELAALYMVAEIANRPTDLKALLEQALDRVVEVTAADGGAIRLLDSQSQDLVLAAERGLSEAYVREAGRFSLSREIVGWVARTGQPSLSKDMWTDPLVSDQVRELLRQVGHRALAQVPLWAQDKIVGTLGVVSRTPDFFTADDLRLLNAIGQQLGVAIANAQLFEETQRRARRLAVLNAVAAVVNQALDLDALLSSAVDKIIEVMGVDAAGVRLVDPEARRLDIAHARGFSTEDLAWLQSGESGEDPAFPLIRQGQPFLVEDRGEASGIRCRLEVPLRSSERVVGSLGVASRTPRAFGPDDVDLLTALGHQLGVAIENARLRQQALEAERLAAVGRVAGTVAHDLRGPLGGIINSAEYLSRPEISDPNRQKLSQGIVAAARRLIGTVQGILDYTRNGRMSLRLASCVLTLFLKEVVDEFRADFRDRGIEIETEFGYEESVRIDPDRMAQVVYNIASNARDAMPEGGRFVIVTQKAGANAEIRFSDTGPGISPHLAERVFDPFVSFGKRDGAGLGLSIARRVVEEHGGQIWVERSRNGGATFVVRLPL
jgi:GAF domain-containing protein